jgi:hypothetical protein
MRFKSFSENNGNDGYNPASFKKSILERSADGAQTDVASVGRTGAAEFCKGRLSVNSASQAFRSRMDNAAAVVVTKLTAYVPLPAELAALLSTGELWTFYLPLMYVVLFPVLNTFLAMFKECWKNAAKRRAKRVMRKLGVVALVTSPQRKGYKDLEAGGKKKAAPAKGKKGLSA